MPEDTSLEPFQLPEQDVFGFLFERKQWHFPQDKVFCIDGTTKRSYTYAEMKNASVDFGKGLRAIWDWKKGDVLALYTPNSIDFMPVMWGTHWAGGVVSTANPAYTVDELSFQLKDCGAKALATQKGNLEIAVQAAKNAGIPDDRIILIGDERDPSAKYKHFTSIRNTSGATRFRRTKLNPKQDLAFLPYSSGTTGRPKGVKLTHSNITSVTVLTAYGEHPYMGYGTDRIMAFLPFFHIYGLTVLLHHAYYMGHELIVMQRFDIEKFCSLIQEHRITMSYVVPPVVLALSKHPAVDAYDLSSIRIFNCGAAPLTRELTEALWARLQKPIKQAYGMTEASPTTHMQPWDRWHTHIGSIGLPLPHMESKFMTPEGKEVPAGEVGELWVKGPNVFVGYINNEAQTRDALTPDGFYKTGDVGYADAAGNCYITDRVKELIKYKGYQVAPAELEGLLQVHPKVADVAVIGIDDKEQATEVPCAFIVVNTGVPETEATGKEIIDWLSKKVSNHKKLRGGVRFEKEIAKSASGKILRRILKDKLLAEGGAVKPKL